MMLNRKEIYAAIISGNQKKKRAMYTTDFTYFWLSKIFRKKLTSSLMVLMDGAPSPMLCKTGQ